MVPRLAHLTVLVILLMIDVIGVQAQCPVGQVEVEFAIRTDSWGHEGWGVTPYGFPLW